VAEKVNIQFDTSEVQDINVDMNLRPLTEKCIETAYNNRTELEIYRIQKKIAEIERRLSEPFDQIFLNFDYTWGASFDRGGNEFGFPLNKPGYKYSLTFEKPLNWHGLTFEKEFEKIGRKAGTNYLEDTILKTDRVTFDLFDNGTDKSTTADAEGEEIYREELFREFRSQMEYRIRKSIGAIAAGRDIIMAQQKNVSTYEEILDIEKEKHDLGDVHMYELLEHHVETLRERQKYIEAFYEYKKAYFTLKYLTGELDENSL
jgi:hypothetical protein